ncbi:MAG: alanine racemase [Ignavibacteriaceae bacterium]
MRDVVAYVNLNNLIFNFKSIQKKTGPSVKVMAVVKADSYGHNINFTVPALATLNRKPDYFGVALADEGAEVRKILSSLSKQTQNIPILVFEPLSGTNIDDIIRFDLEATIFEKSHLNLLRKQDKKIRVQIKVDTGMGRLGINFKNAVDFIKLASSIKNVQIAGIYTHFATSDSKDKSFANLQLSRFKNLIDDLKKQNINYGIAHCANSGAIIDMPDAYLDMVRPGISLYGYYPSLEVTGSLPLKPVMSIEARIASVKVASKGDSVGYGQLYFPKQGEIIFSVGMGYADGYSRAMTNAGFCIYKGKKFRQVGRVSMDRIMFSAGKEIVKTGDRVTLLGGSGKMKYDAWDWAKVTGTIPYEVTCGISKRVGRKLISL